MEDTKKIEYEIWETRYKINLIDKEYKNQNPKEIRNGIIQGSTSLAWAAILALFSNLAMSDTFLNIFATANVVLLSLKASLSLGPKVTYKFRKKRLENKLEQLNEKRLNSMGIFTIDDYEIVLDADDEDIDKEIFAQKTKDTNEISLFEDGGKHVR